MAGTCVTDRTPLDGKYLPYLLAYMSQCADSAEYPDPEIAGRLYQVDFSVRRELKARNSSGNGKEISRRLCDAWILLANARVAGARIEMENVFENATALGVLLPTKDGFVVESVSRGQFSNENISHLQHLAMRAAFVHDDIAGALLRTMELGSPSSEISDVLVNIQSYMRDLRDLREVLVKSLIDIRGPLAIEMAEMASKTSIAEAQALSEALQNVLAPGEKVAIVAAATLLNLAEEAGYGTYQGVLIVTTTHVRFLFNPFHHEIFWDLPNEQNFPLSDVLRFVKNPRRIGTEHGYQLKLGQQLDMLLVSERPSNPRYLSFYLEQSRLREFTKLRVRSVK
jgi:hypothetical protein